VDLIVKTEEISKWTIDILQHYSTVA